MPSSSRNARSVRTMSATVITGKSDPYGLPVAGSIDDGPVVPRQPPSRFVETTKKRSVSNALPGPIIPSHQPSPLPAEPSRSSAPNPSRVLCSAASFEKPAAWASPLSAWQTRITLSRCGRERAVGLVRHADRVQLPPAVEPHRVRQVEVLRLDGADRAGRRRRGCRHRCVQCSLGGVADVYCQAFLCWEARLRRREG